MTWDCFNIFLLIATVLLALYYYNRQKHNYWRARGVKGPTPWPIVGNIGKVFFRKTSLADFLMEIYNGYKSEPFVGFYSGLQPILLVKDPAFIKDILIKDFPVFSSRGLFGSDKVST
jgi:cytochrome P450 family 6